MNWSIYSSSSATSSAPRSRSRGSPRSCSSRRSSGSGSSAGTASRRASTSRRSGSSRSARWLSAFFIIVANSWMQRPGRLDGPDGRAELTSVWELLTNRFAIWAYVHVLLVGLTTGGDGRLRRRLLAPRRRGRNVELFRPRAKLALIVGVPVSAVNLGVGSHLGVVVTDYQPMKIAATEALWDTEQPCAFSLFQIGGFSRGRPDAELRHRDPAAALDPRDRLVGRRGAGDEPSCRREYEPEYGPANYIPPVRTTYWSMRIMAYAGTLVFLSRRSARSSTGGGARLERRAGSSGSASSDPPPVPRGARRLGALRGRAPAVDRAGLLKTADANSPSVSDVDDRAQPRRLRAPLRRARRRRLRAHAPLRAPRPARGRRRAATSSPLPAVTTDGPRDLLVLPHRRPLGRATSCSRASTSASGCCCRSCRADERARATMFETIGPVWDGNEVWLVVAGGATFAAFPAWYATMFSGFYLALLLVLVFLIVRVVSFEWRRKSESARWRATWTWANTIGSFGALLVWGVGLANLLYGVPIDSDGDFAGNFSICSARTPCSPGSRSCCSSPSTARRSSRCGRRATCERRRPPRGGSRSRRGGRRAASSSGRSRSRWTATTRTSSRRSCRRARDRRARARGRLRLRAGASGRAFAMTALGDDPLVATLFVSLYPRVMVSSTDFANSLTGRRRRPRRTTRSRS